MTVHIQNLRGVPFSLKGVLFPVILAALLLWTWTASGKDAVPTIRWTEGNPGCTFSRGDDGKYRWAVWTDEVAVSLAVDSQELQKTRRRQERIFGVLLNVHYRGSGTLKVNPQKTTLEFVNHFHTVTNSLHPDYFSKEIQKKADDLADETEHQIQKHPEKKDEKESYLRDYANEVSELTRFLSTHSLREATLDPGNREVSGWIFFETKSKWIGDWKKQETFLLRFPFKNRVFEFPFTLPPSEGDLILRRRELH